MKDSYLFGRKIIFQQRETKGKYFESGPKLLTTTAWELKVS
jgi:hypothetical protein